MKTLKKILIVLAVLVALILIIGFFLPRKVHMERSITMKGSTKNAFDQVNTLKNWEGWSPWQKMDPKMVITYSGPASGKDAKYAWKSEKSDVGNGTLTIIESDPDSLVKVEMEFMGRGKGNSAFSFKKTADGTNVTWSFDSDMGNNPVMHYMGMMMDKMMGKTFDQGLTDMKNIVEKMPATSAADYKIEETTSKDMHIITINYKWENPVPNYNQRSAEVGAKCKEGYAKLNAYIKKSGLKTAGPPFAIYNDFKPTKVDMAPGFVVDKETKGEGDIMGSEMKAGNVCKVSYMGPYNKLGEVHMAINQYIKDNKKEQAGSPWEVYINDPMKEKDSTKLQTDVYYPIK